jgi:hypothetical protein
MITSQHLITKLFTVYLLFDGFSNKEITPLQCLQLMHLLMKPQSRFKLTTMCQSSVKSPLQKLFPPTLISVLTSDQCRFVGGTEIMVFKMAFATLSV